MLYEILKALHIVAVIAWMAACSTCRACSSITPTPRRVPGKARLSGFYPMCYRRGPLSSPAISREKVPQAICTRAACRQISTRFIHRNDMEGEGYGEYLDQVEEV